MRYDSQELRTANEAMANELLRITAATDKVIWTRFCLPAFRSPFNVHGAGESIAQE